jgi:hypothetical protein
MTSVADPLSAGEFAGLVAVRSSAVGEDSAGASFAGQHVTVLGVGSPEGRCETVRSVWRSAASASAIAYRAAPRPRQPVLGGRAHPGPGRCRRRRPAVHAQSRRRRGRARGRSELGVDETVVTGRVVSDRSGSAARATSSSERPATRTSRSAAPTTTQPTSGEWRPGSSSDCASRTRSSETSADSPTGARRCSARHATSSGRSLAERSTSSSAMTRTADAVRASTG